MRASVALHRQGQFLPEEQPALVLALYDAAKKSWLEHRETAEGDAEIDAADDVATMDPAVEDRA